MVEVKREKIWKFVKGDIEKDVQDEVAIEAPLEIFLDDMLYTVTMRLPNDDFDLVRGLLFANGVIEEIDDIGRLAYCEDSENVIYVELKNRRTLERTDGFVHKSFSSCGICGKVDIEDILINTRGIKSRRSTISPDELYRIKKDFESRMTLFLRTGCVHAVGIYSPECVLLGFGEDVGRHNAFDKAVGKVLFDKNRDKAALAMCSSRLSLEMVQKAARIGVEFLVGISAPTSLAVELADEWDITLIGFLREERFNIYTHPLRINLSGCC